ncbi:MAG TPA: DinB family protein [Pyrinomonadaceae bacterium]|nr:DinB family protein [Pyrinomonadaceae bacterium]
MDTSIDKTCSDLAAVANAATEAFGNLSAEQLNWKPSEKQWSIAQCFDHLITTHSLYAKDLDRLASGDTKMSFWERYSPLSGFFGRFLIKGLDPKNTKKMTTTAKASPAKSEIGVDIIERFSAHQDDLAEQIRRASEKVDPEKQIVTSPLLWIVTYSLADALTFIPMHCERHFDQAKRVMANEGFPA